MEKKCLWVCVTLTMCLMASVSADSNKDRSFINIENPIPCIRRFNATHQIGCAKSDIDSYKGIVLAIRNASELLRLQSTEFGSHKIVVITTPSFYPIVVDYYLAKPETSPINGIVLIASEGFGTAEPVSFSDDSVRPNEMYDMYSRGTQSDLSAVDWNADKTNSYMFKQFDIPVYILTEEKEALKIINDCYEKFNRKVVILNSLRKYMLIFKL